MEPWDSSVPEEEEDDVDVWSLREKGSGHFVTPVRARFGVRSPWEGDEITGTGFPSVCSPTVYHTRARRKGNPGNFVTLVG